MNKIKILYSILCFLIYNIVFSQNIPCSGTLIFDYSGINVINGVEVNVSRTGDALYYSTPNNVSSCSGSTFSGRALRVGGDLPGNPTAWSVTFTFNKSINDLVILINGTGGTTGGTADEDFNFFSNGGDISISTNYVAICDARISGNTILSGKNVTTQTGGGVFKISAPNNYTTLTINGAGGQAGSVLSICSSSIIAKPTINSLTPLTQSVCVNKKPLPIVVSAVSSIDNETLYYKWYKNTNNSNTGGTIITEAVSSSYTPPISTIENISYYYVVVSDTNGSTTSDPVELVTRTINCICTKPGNFPSNITPNPTRIGITVQQKEDQWPESINNGFIALESKTKGFVITRVETLGDNIDGTPTYSDSILDPKEGMLAYDITDACVKLFTNDKWKCIEKSCNE